MRQVWPVFDGLDIGERCGAAEGASVQLPIGAAEVVLFVSAVEFSSFMRTAVCEGAPDPNELFRLSVRFVPHLRFEIDGWCRDSGDGYA